MQSSFSTRARSLSAWKTALPSLPMLAPSRGPQRSPPHPASTSIPEKVFNNIIPIKRPAAVKAPQRAIRAVTPPLPSSALNNVKLLESLYKIITDKTLDFPVPPTPLALEKKRTEAIASELRASRVEVTSLQTALEHSERQVELLRVNTDCYKYAMADTYHRLQERDQLAVSLQLRLHKQLTNPHFLDLETDPLIERDSIAIVKDAYVTQLHHENAELLQRMHDMQVQLDAFSSCNCK